MIDIALKYVRDILNESIKNEFSKKDYSARDVVVLSNIIKADGSSAEKVDGKIVFFLVNLDEEATLKNSINRSSGGGSSFVHTNPALHLNMHILFCANFDSSLYIEGLQYLSAVIRFFQINKKIEVNFTGSTAQKRNTLNFELCKLNYDQLSHIWSAIGSKLMPAVMYKVGLLVFDDTPISRIIPRITNPENKS